MTAHTIRFRSKQWSNLNGCHFSAISQKPQLVVEEENEEKRLLYRFIEKFGYFFLLKREKIESLRRMKIIKRADSTMLQKLN